VDLILAQSDDMPPRQRALALSAAAFGRIAGGDQALARRLLKRSLPLHRQARDRLGLGLTAAALGHLLAAQNQLAVASDLLEQTLAQLREMAGEPLTAPQRLQYLLDVALASNAPPPCSPRPGRCLRPAAAAGCTPTCRAPRTATAPGPPSGPA
jgi:hypothetical protein